MALTYKQKRRWSLVLLIVFLPIYIIVAVAIMSAAARAPFVIELLIYVVLGVGWILPFKNVFLGIGQGDPDAETDDKE
jgi:hypothetical protein|uniref:DUF2842 domain-containing protein n=1 Tax=Yoonia sp. TaxID=2212373 RepID=UPI004048E1A8|tara:strand:+ start:687 stop:920 length:234 start_codon:yes stop_codon:yes gene_type:complete